MVCKGACFQILPFMCTEIHVVLNVLCTRQISVTKWEGFLFSSANNFGLFFHQNYAKDIQNYSFLHVDGLRRFFYAFIYFFPIVCTYIDVIVSVHRMLPGF